MILLNLCVHILGYFHNDWCFLIILETVVRFITGILILLIGAGFLCVFRLSLLQHN